MLLAQEAARPRRVRRCHRRTCAARSERAGVEVHPRHAVSTPRCCAELAAGRDRARHRRGAAGARAGADGRPHRADRLGRAARCRACRPAGSSSPTGAATGSASASRPCSPSRATRSRSASSGYYAGQRLQQYVRDAMIGEATKLGVEMVPLVRPYGADDDTVYLQHVLTGEPVIVEPASARWCCRRATCAVDGPVRRRCARSARLHVHRRLPGPADRRGSRPGGPDHGHRPLVPTTQWSRRE